MILSELESAEELHLCGISYMDINDEYLDSGSGLGSI